MHFPHISVIHILKAMGLRNTLVIQHLCHGLKYRLQEFFLRSELKLDLDLTPSHTPAETCKDTYRRTQTHIQAQCTHKHKTKSKCWWCATELCIIQMCIHCILANMTQKHKH